MIVSNLGQIMKERRLTALEVSEKTGIGRNTISSFIHGRANGIQFKTLGALCDFLDVTPNDLLLVSIYNMDVHCTLHDNRLCVDLLVTEKRPADWKEYEESKNPSGDVYSLIGEIDEVSSTLNIKLRWKKPETANEARKEAVSFMGMYTNLPAAIRTAAKRQITDVVMDVMKNFRGKDEVVLSWTFPQDFQNYLVRMALNEQMGD